MNRTSKENLVVPVTHSFQMQVREPYLIFRMEKSVNEQKIRGIWFHDSGEREAVSKLLNRVVKIVSSSDDEREVTNGAQVKNMSHSEATASLLSALKIDKSVSNQQNKDEQNEGKVLPTEKQSERVLLENMELDKKSLQLSLMSLLQDERFLDLIHAQYIKIVRSRKKDED